MKVVSQRLVANLNLKDIDDVHANFDKDGNIDGIKILDNVSQRLLELRRPLPYEYPFQSKVIFCRYKKFYKHFVEYKKETPERSEKYRRIQILVVEAQLTNEARSSLFQYQQFMVLNNAIRCLLNMAPFNAHSFEKEFFALLSQKGERGSAIQFQRRALDFMLETHNPL